MTWKLLKRLAYEISPLTVHKYMNVVHTATASQ